MLQCLMVKLIDYMKPCALIYWLLFKTPCTLCIQDKLLSLLQYLDAPLMWLNVPMSHG